MTPLATIKHMKLSLKVMLSLAIFLALTVVKTYPLIGHFGTHLPSDLGDPLLVTWILAWGLHALSTNPWNLFNANIFYPVENTLALSEHMIAVLPVFAPAYVVTGNPIFAYNTVFFLSFILCGITMFLLVEYWTNSFWASLLAGCLFAFAPIRFAEVSHLQLYSLYWAPLTCLFLDKFLRRKRWGDLTWFAICYWLQVLSSVYLGWLTTIAIGVYTLSFVIWIDRSLLCRTFLSRYLAFSTASILILLPFHIPYYTLKQQWGFSTSLVECIDWSADLVLNYLSPPHLLNDVYLSLARSLNPRLHNPPNQMMLFPGLVLGILATLGSLPGAKWLPASKAQHVKRLFVMVGASSFLLSLGPFLVISGNNTSIPLPYLLFYYLVPGFQAIRVPARFALMVVMAGSVLAALGFLRVSNYLRSRWSGRQPSVGLLQGLLGLFCLTMFTMELGFKPLPLASIPTGRDVPAVYRWLATKEFAGPIVELPLRQDFWQALKYMYFSTYHWLPIVNGASRFLPPTHAQLNSEITSLPSFEAVELLSRIRVKGLVVHTDQLAPQEVARWQLADLADIGLEEVARFGSDVVYQLLPLETAPQRDLVLAMPDRRPNGEVMRLPAGAMMRFGLIVESGGQHLWVHPPPLGRTQVQIRWEKVQTGSVHIQREKVELPLVLRTRQVWSAGLPIRTPPSSGHYKLSLDMPTLDLKASPKLVEISSEAYQTSANTSQSLSAAYILEEPSSNPITSRIIDVTLQATNTGQGIWLADAKHDRGKVRLGWRWFRGNKDIPFKEGREDLQYDVFPGQAYRFKMRINAPLDPGEYTLELGLVCELLTWFSDRGVAPLKFDVRVQGAVSPSSP
jgi:hypothetical protein